jgi:hypothetical protein
MGCTCARVFTIGITALMCCLTAGGLVLLSTAFPSRLVSICGNETQLSTFANASIGENSSAPTAAAPVTTRAPKVVVPCSHSATTCRLHLAEFFIIRNSFCFSLRYDVAVQSLTNASEWTRGYYAVSCDVPNGHCCNGILIPQSDASTGNTTLPCWVPDVTKKFVSILTPAPTCPVMPLPTTDVASTPAPLCTVVPIDVIFLHQLAAGAFCFLAVLGLIACVACCDAGERVRNEYASVHRAFCQCVGTLAPPNPAATAAPVPQGFDENPLFPPRPRIENPLAPRTVGRRVQPTHSDFLQRAMEQIDEYIDEDCPICLEPLGAAYSILKCGHRIHGSPCLDGIFNMYRNPAEAPCIFCRMPTRISEVIVVQPPHARHAVT